MIQRESMLSRQGDRLTMDDMRIAGGDFPSISTVNKFGRNTDIDTATTPEDIWDVGGVWVAPTQARTHDVASSSADDAVAGTGARTVRLYGLTDWNTPEVTETVTLNGVSNVATANSYVIVHRIQCMTFGSGGVNAGNITATAQTDATVTAQVSIGKGQTLMAIYGVPSGYDFYMIQWYTNWSRAVGAANNADLELLVESRAGQSDAGFVVKHDLGLFGSGDTHIPHEFKPPFKIAGPAIIKVSVASVSANDTDISAGFDGYLVS